uniref:Uncharacterized protein n=1 Tax=Oryza punctata TaxID=4537 RepID=A0A0E0MNJ8_ORYPU
MDQQPRAPSPLSPPSLSPLPSDMDQQPTATGSMLLWKAKSTQSGGIVGRFIRLLLLEERMTKSCGLHRQAAAHPRHPITGVSLVFLISPQF